MKPGSAFVVGLIMGIATGHLVLGMVLGLIAAGFIRARSSSHSS